MTIRYRFLSFALFLLALAACDSLGGADVAVLPTLAQFPTATPTIMPAAGSPTHPATQELMPTLTGVPTSDAPGGLTTNQSPTETDSPTALPSGTPTAAFTLTPTVTPSLTITPTPTLTPSDTITPTPILTETPDRGSLGGLIDLALRATILPVTVLPAAPPPGMVAPTPAPLPVSCAAQVTGGFASLYAQNNLAASLGCPSGGETTLVTALQTFERGTMIYLSGSPGTILVLYTGGQFRRYPDTWVENVDPASGGEAPPAGFFEPIRGFGKVWRTNSEVRQGLGWAISTEAGNTSRLLRFDRGQLVYMPQRDQTFALVESADGSGGTWQAFAGGA